MVDRRLYALLDPAVAGGRTLIGLAARVADVATLVQLRHKNSDTAPDPAQAARELRAVVKYALKRRETS